jgi:hypothetical protein
LNYSEACIEISRIVHLKKLEIEALEEKKGSPPGWKKPENF